MDRFQVLIHSLSSGFRGPVLSAEVGVAVDALCELIRVLEHPARRAVLLALAGHPMDAGALGPVLGLDIPTMESHLRPMEHAGLIGVSRGTDNGVTYHLQDCVAVAFAAGKAEARVTASDGSVLSFITNAPHASAAPSGEN